VIGEAPATFVWISPEPPGAAELRALSSWARTRGVTVAPPAEKHPAALAVDLAEADSIEELLDRARDAIAARDGDGVERATAAAEALLRAHPELPQSAWLMAEIERARATRWQRVPPEDAEASERAWLRAEALDGGRVAGIREVAAAGATAGALPASVSLSLPGDDAARLDGRPLEGVLQTTVETRRGTTRSVVSVVTVAGPHVLVVTADGAPVWAGWLELAAGTSSIVVDAPTTVPCSLADLGHATPGGAVARAVGGVGAIAPATGNAVPSVNAVAVACPSWLAVAAGKEPGTVRVAQCEADLCGPFADWPVAPAWTRVPPTPAVEGGEAGVHRWPAWASWALAGAGVALAAGVVVVASGALLPAPNATRFVSGGLKSQ